MPSRAPDSIDLAVGRNVRIYRLARNMSQSELGERLGISFQQIQKYERGTNRSGAGRLVRIAGILDVPVTNLLGRHAGSPQADGQCVVELLADRQQLRLAQAFAAIADADDRNAILGLVERLAAREQG